MAILQSMTINDTGNLTLPVGTAANRPTITSTVVSFTTVGSSSWTVPAGVTQIEVLVVGGGGGGGNTEGNSGAQAGGGGAGGVIYVSNYAVTPAASISYTVGGGGAQQATSGQWGNNGSNSVFGNLTAIGGGGGGADYTSSPFGSTDPQRRRGRDGGSGGGGGFNAQDPTIATAGQGHRGGLGGIYPSYGGMGGGGGGAGEPGYDGSTTAPGRGGNGLMFSISGTVTYYGGGGGSGGNTTNNTTAAPGGLGGGGAGAPRVGPGVVSPGVAGTANTGGGGGGGCTNQGSAASVGGAGGSGIIIVKYSLNASSANPVGQSRLNTNSGALEIYGHNNRWSSSYADNGIVTNGLMAHYDGKSLASGVTTWPDLSGNGYNGTLFNSPTYNSGDGSVSFNGSTQYMGANVSSTLLDGDPSFTAELFLKIDASFSAGAPWGIGGGGQGKSIGGWTPTTNRIHMDLYDSTRQDSLKDYPIGKYVHVVWTKTGTGVQSSNIACYINGILTSTTQTRAVTTGPIFNTSTAGISLGRLNADSAGNAAPCTVGVYRVYSRALSYREILQNYNAQCERFSLSKFSTTTPGGSPLTAVPNPAALRSAGIWKDGAYWIQPVGQPASLTYVRFNFIDGGDWMLLMKVYNPNDMTSGSAFWTNSTLYNDTDFNLSSGTWSKYGIWNTYTFTRLCMQMQARSFPIMIWNTGRTMFNFINGNSPGAGFAGYPCDSTDPAIGSNVLYDTMPMKIGATIGTAQTGSERYVQGYGINCWGNNSSNGVTDTRGYSSLGRAGAWIGAAMDEGTHTFNAVANGGSDSGIGMGGGAGNSTRTWSAGWGEWSSSVPIDSLPGYVWVR